MLWPQKTDLTRHLLHISGKAMQLEVGYCGKLLAAPLCLADNVTNLWIKHVWVSTQECGVMLLTDYTDVPLQCQGDLKLMQLFV